MTDVSDEIKRIRREWEERGPAAADELASLREHAAGRAPVRSLVEALSADSLALIVEPKRATLRRGTIHDDLDVATVVAECAAGGASAVSIVTERALSQGKVDDLRDAREATSLPLMARDFIVDARQVFELRAAGADALLIAVEAHLEHEPDAEPEATQDDHGTGTLAAIIREAHALSMDVVLSVCTDEELAFAIEQDADALNIDNRDDDGSVDVERTFELLADVPVGWPVISESIASVDQVAKLHRAGVDALLLDEGHIDTGLANALAVYADLTLDA